MVNLITRMVSMETVWRVRFLMEILWYNHTLGKITGF